MLRRLRIKFICVNMGIVAAMLAVIFGLELHFTRQDLEGESLRQLQLVAERLDRPREEGEGPRERPLTEPENAARPDLSDQRGFLPYLLLRCGADGSVEEVSGNFSYDGDVSALAAAVLAAAEPGGVLEDSALRYLRTETPEGLRIVFTDMSGEQNTMDGLLRTSLLVGAASLALFFLLSLLLARWAVKPVEEAWDQQKQFVSDASHELKTPLTVITTNAELLQSPDFDQSARGRFADNILTMSRQMRGLVEGLLELARVDAGAVAKTMEELDLGALCAETVLPFEPLCYERGLTLNTELEEAVRVRGSAVHMRQAVEILLDNAQKYAHSGTEVWLRLERRGKGHCVLSVTDTGDPIAPEDLPHLFERFYRADKARARNGSYGLGLAIAKQVTEAHRGRISCESREGVTKFSLLLPTV